MKTPNHRTSGALNAWAAIVLLVGIVGILAYFIVDDISLLIAGIACIMLRPLFRALCVLVRASETSLFAKEDPDFIIERKDKE
jgi:hypothetical protein